MDQHAPRYSILLPTYNRGFILPLAIQSVLNQTFSDFELIISNGGSTDDTEAAVSRFDDSRIRYFASERRLTMAENYEFTLKKAEGDFVVFFSDDDAFVPSMLARVDHVVTSENIDMVVFPFAHYYHEYNIDIGVENNSLSFPSFSGRVWRTPSAVDLKRMAGIYKLSKQPPDSKTINPLIGNVVFNRRISQRLYARVPRLFATVPVDIYVISLILSLINEYCVLDAPLLAWSQWERNSSISKTNNLRAHYESLLGGKTLDFVPLEFPLPTNCAANALLEAFNDLGEATNVLEIDWKHYFSEMHNYLIYLEGEGVDVSRELREFDKTLSAQPNEVREYVRSDPSSRNFELKRRLKKVFPRAVIQRIRGFSGRKMDEVIVSGYQAGFSNVLESAGYLDEVLKSGNQPSK